jgi:hypothetical protein
MLSLGAWCILIGLSTVGAGAFMGMVLIGYKVLEHITKP